MKKIPGAADISKEFTAFKRERDKSLRAELDSLVEDMKGDTPVDTGFLKKSYSVPRKIAVGHYRITNRAHYSYQLLILGRTGPGMGSLQLPMGMLPKVREWVTKMEGK